MSKLDERGREIFDQTPLELRFPVVHEEDLSVRIKRMVLAEMEKQNAVIHHREEIEDENDFDFEEDIENFDSPYTELTAEEIKELVKENGGDRSNKFVARQPDEVGAEGDESGEAVKTKEIE